MAAGRYTFRVFHIGLAVTARLDALTFPTFQNRRPTVEFSDTDPSLGNETIAVSANPDESLAQWARVGPAGRDELTSFDVTHRLVAPNIKTSTDVWNRLHEVADLVQSIVYDTAAETTTLLGYPGEVQFAYVAAVVPRVYPSDSGWHGECVVTFQFRSRI